MSAADSSFFFDPNAGLVPQNLVEMNPAYVPPSQSGVTVIPDTSGIDLAGQLNGIPGGYASNGMSASADPSGVNGLFTDPGVNPTPTGGYMDALTAVIKAAATGFTTYAKGSPSVAIPGAKTPTGKTTGGGLLTTATGQTNWTTIGVIVVLGIVGIVVVVRYI